MSSLETRITQLIQQAQAKASEEKGADVAQPPGWHTVAAQQLHAWGMDEATQATAIIHNFVCDGWLDVSDLRTVLPPEAARKVAQLSADYAQIVLHSVDSGRGKARARRRIAYFLAAYHAPDLALMATALLWAQIHHRRAASGHEAAVALEDARHILCPLLDMLGMQALRETLYQELWPAELEAAPEPAAQKLFEQVSQTFTDFMADAVCERRFPCPEGPSTARRAATRLPLSIDVAVCVPTVEACYRALYHIHQRYQVVDGSFTDYLRQGRINGWRALHTAVNVFLPVAAASEPQAVSATIGRDAQQDPRPQERARVNFHIYAAAMAPINRWGLAAARRIGAVASSSKGANTRDSNTRDANTSDAAPNAWWNQASQGKAQIDVAPAGALPETLYVFSPHGQLFRFHRGCTVVDFAYHVHTELADQCRRFYINDEPVEPNAVLHHLDQVTLEHDPLALGPTQVWLNAAHTSRARNAIERFLNRRGQGMDVGRRILDERRRHLEQHYGFNLPEHRLAQALAATGRRLRLNRSEDVWDELAAGRLAADQVLHPLFAEEIARQIQIPRGLGVRPHQLQISQCCRPRPGEDIVGLVARRHGQITRLRVHRQNCPRVLSSGKPASPTLAPPEQLELQWRLQPRLTVSAQLELTAHDEDELLGDAVKQVYARLPLVTLRKVEAAAHHGVARLRFHLEATDQEVLEELTAALEGLPNRQVVEVRRLHLPPSEIEMAEAFRDRASYNPYSRLPVHEQAMFFGRSRELATIQEWLQAGAGNIWLLGQKRVGKTSLLFHLKHHFLPERGFTAAFVDFQLLGNPGAGNLCCEIAAAVFADLQDDPYIGEIGPPLRSLFDLQPAAELIAYLRAISSRIRSQSTRVLPQRQPSLVLLLDEFSRITDAYQQGQIDRSFFDLWRGIIQATVPEISYITVVQQQTYNTIARRALPFRAGAQTESPRPAEAQTKRQPNTDVAEAAANGNDNNEDPSWHIMELGEKLVLRPLDREDVRRLIEWPMRNFVEFSPESVDEIAALTGGHPFLIQAFCFKLAAHMGRQEQRHTATNKVEWHDIEAVRMEFMLPTESVFAHFLDMQRGVGNQVSQTLANLAEAQTDPARRDSARRDDCAPSVEDGAVTWDALHAALPDLPAPILQRTLQELAACDILVELSPVAPTHAQTPSRTGAAEMDEASPRAGAETAETGAETGTGSAGSRWAFASRLFQQWLALNAA